MSWVTPAGPGYGYFTGAWKDPEGPDVSGRDRKEHFGVPVVTDRVSSGSYCTQLNLSKEHLLSDI